MTRRKTLDARLTRLIVEQRRIEDVLGTTFVGGTSKPSGDWGTRANSAAIGALRDMATAEKARVDRRVWKVARKIVRRNHRGTARRQQLSGAQLQRAAARLLAER